MTLIGGYTNPRFRDSFNAANDPDVPLDMERIFYATQSWPWTEVVTQVNAGHTPIVSTKLTGSWAQAATGSNNVRLDKVVDELVKLDISKLEGVPCLSFNHEPENDGGVLADYNAMWKYFSNRYRTKLRTAGWDLCFIFMGGTWRGWTPWTIANIETAISGTNVDRVYADLYEKPGGSGNWATKPWVDPDDPASPFRQYNDWCRAKNVKAGLPEVGINRKQTDDGSQATFLDALADSALAEIAQFFIYYDRDVGEGGATSNTRLIKPECFRSFAKLYDEVVVPPAPDDCDEVKAELAATEEELAATKAALQSQEIANDNLITELSKTQTERDAALEKLAQIHTISG